MTSFDRGDGHLEEARTWARACRHIALRVGSFDVPANAKTARHFFTWLDARQRAWARLVRWWDAHPDVLARRLEALARG
jgi:hypothetical protein